MCFLGSRMCRQVCVCGKSVSPCQVVINKDRNIGFTTVLTLTHTGNKDSLVPVKCAMAKTFFIS